MTMLNDMAISEFWSGDFEEKMSVEGSLGALPFLSFWKGTRTFNFSYNEPSHKILGPLGWYNPPGKNNNKKTNKHTSVICLVAKNTKFHIFVDKSMELLL